MAQPLARNFPLVYSGGALHGSAPSKSIQQYRRGEHGTHAALAGLLRHDGRNTIGTSGQPASPNEPEARTDQSQAATDQHHSDKVRQEGGPIGNRAMNNGTFPEMTVQQVSGTGEKCVATAGEEQR